MVTCARMISECGEEDHSPDQEDGGGLLRVGGVAVPGLLQDRHGPPLRAAEGAAGPDPGHGGARRPAPRGLQVPGAHRGHRCHTQRLSHEGRQSFLNN